jgi:hypothetical protein
MCIPLRQHRTRKLWHIIAIFGMAYYLTVQLTLDWLKGKKNSLELPRHASIVVKASGNVTDNDLVMSVLRTIKPASMTKSVPL